MRAAAPLSLAASEALIIKQSLPEEAFGSTGSLGEIVAGGQEEGDGSWQHIQWNRKKYLLKSA